MKLLKSNSENEVVKYPYSLGELRKEYPNVSFPNPLTKEALAAYNCFIVTEKKPPTDYNKVTKNITSSIHLVKGKWIQRWTIADATPENIALRTEEQLRRLDYKGFWKAFTRTAAYTALKTAASTDLSANVLATELISVFADAKAGNLDAEAMQAGVNETLVSLRSINETLATETEELLTFYKISFT